MARQYLDKGLVVAATGIGKTSPERLDNKDVFALCDYNIVYEVRLKEAIDKGWLVPFRYYGVFDETDYTKISFRNGKYDEAELEKALMINKRSNLILKHYEKYNSKRALRFCRVEDTPYI